MAGGDWPRLELVWYEGTHYLPHGRLRSGPRTGLRRCELPPRAVELGSALGGLQLMARSSPGWENLALLPKRLRNS